MKLTIRNVRLPYLQHRLQNSFELAVLIKDEDDITQVEISSFVRAFFAQDFGVSTDLIQSDDEITFSLETPYALPSGVYFRLILFPGYYNSIDDLTFTCLSECASSPTFSEDQTIKILQVDGVLDSDVSEGSVIEFTLGGLIVPDLEERKVFHYQIGYNEGVILENQSSFGV